MAKHMLKIVLGLAIIFLIPCITKAQDQDEFKNSTPEQRAEFQTEWMKTELSLDSAVVSTVYEINLKYAKRNQALMNSEGARLKKFRDMKSSSEAKDSELKKIFTIEQYKIYQQKKEEMKQKMKQKIQERRKNG
jgi:hypothetical protein